MFRFTMPDPTLPIAEQAGQLRCQGRAFLQSGALRELLALLDTDEREIGIRYNGRAGAGGHVSETQELGRSERIDRRRLELYPLFAELGFFGINAPLERGHSHIVVLGGSLDACRRRSQCALALADRSTRRIDGVACFRPINPVERRQAARGPACETEFGALAGCFEQAFGLRPDCAEDDFCGDRNLNAISCVRTYGARQEAGGRTCRVLAAPSSQPGLRRADTGDGIAFYLRSEPLDPADSPLFITDNRHCNRQFLQIAFQLLRLGRPARLDVVGCTPDERIVTPDAYDPFQFVQDLIGTLDWIGRLEAATPPHPAENP